MKPYCIRDQITGQVFKVLFTEEEFQNFLKETPNMIECIDCVECIDAPSITLE
jgi:polyferredoxin